MIFFYLYNFRAENTLLISKTNIKKKNELQTAKYGIKHVEITVKVKVQIQNKTIVSQNAPWSFK